MEEPAQNFAAHAVSEDACQQNGDAPKPPLKDKSHILALEQVHQAQEDHQRGRRGEKALINAQGQEDQHSASEKRQPPTVEIPQIYGSHCQQQGQIVTVQLVDIGGGLGGEGQVHTHDSAGQHQKQRIAELQHSGHQEQAQTHKHQRQQADEPGQGEIAPEQRPVNRDDEAPVFQLPLVFPGRGVEGVQGVVGKIAVEKAVAVGDEAPAQDAEQAENQPPVFEKVRFLTKLLRGGQTVFTNPFHHCMKSFPGVNGACSERPPCRTAHSRWRTARSGRKRQCFHFAALPQRHSAGHRR